MSRKNNAKNAELVAETQTVEQVNVWPESRPGIAMANDGKKLLIIASDGSKAAIEVDRIFNVVISNRAVSFLFK